MKLSVILLATVLLINMNALDLSSYRWRKRLVLLFSGEHLPAQKTLLAKAGKGLEERDVEVISVSAKEENLHAKYQVKAGQFAFVLVGKDGGEKFRSKDLVTSVDLFAQIDAMPMRQDEAKRK